ARIMMEVIRDMGVEKTVGFKPAGGVRSAEDAQQFLAIADELFIPPGPRLGDKVLEVSHLRKSYGDRVLIDDLSFSVPKGAI
ncbi:hypothetical protein LUD23_30520, partial [Klebsiella pneumoniae]|uniref:hypothetical protein n=1 Tax=Klebsiella pneumoniae TaxID=573 RepID=UPI003B199EEE|nr:hypothetical protein [Klebsiella pneumoniae]